MDINSNKHQIYLHTHKCAYISQRKHIVGLLSKDYCKKACSLIFPNYYRILLYFISMKVFFNNMGFKRQRFVLFFWWVLFHFFSFQCRFSRHINYHIYIFLESSHGTSFTSLSDDLKIKGSQTKDPSSNYSTTSMEDSQHTLILLN